MLLSTEGLVKKYPMLLKYKPGLDFLARLFFIGAIFLCIKKAYGWGADRHGYLNLPYFGPTSFIEFIRNPLLHASKKIIEFLGHPAILHGWVVGIDGGGAVRVETPCIGINVCFAFIILVLSYPSHLHWGYKTLFLFAGLFIIQLLNLVRIVGMVFVIHNRYALPMEHHDLYNLIIYITIFGMFYLFTSISKIPSQLHPKLD